MGIHHKAKPRKLAFAKKMRRKPTRAEREFWEIAKRIKSRDGVIFWRQAVILGWIVDFWCPKYRLAVEIDGPSHDKRVRYDKRRANVMEEELGIMTIRFSNSDVITNPLIVETKLRNIILACRRRENDQ